MKIYLHDYFGANIIDADTAKDVLHKIVDAAKCGDVEVSFHKINITVLHPMHIFVGMLFAPENVEYVERVRFIDMCDDTQAKVNLVAHNAVRHYNVSNVIVANSTTLHPIHEFKPCCKGGPHSGHEYSCHYAFEMK